LCVKLDNYQESGLSVLVRFAHLVDGMQLIDFCRD